MQHRIENLGEVMRGHRCRHTDGNALTSVAEKVRESSGKNRRLVDALKVVRHPVDCFALEVFEHLHRKRRHAALGVSHRSRRVAVDGTEVSLAVNQGVAVRKRLCHTHEGRVNDLLSVRVEVALGVTRDLGTLDVSAVGAQIEPAHGIEDATLDGF